MCLIDISFFNVVALYDKKQKYHPLFGGW